MPEVLSIPKGTGNGSEIGHFEPHYPANIVKWLENSPQVSKYGAGRPPWATIFWPLFVFFLFGAFTLSAFITAPLRLALLFLSFSSVSAHCHLFLFYALIIYLTNIIFKLKGPTLI